LAQKAVATMATAFARAYSSIYFSFLFSFTQQFKTVACCQIAFFACLSADIVATKWQQMATKNSSFSLPITAF